ncbi:hypothetical protein D3C76_923950 [compost metagenome]
MCRRDFQCQQKFTSRINGQVELVTEPSDLVAKGVVLRSPIRIAGLLALFLGLLLFVSMDSSAIDRDVATVDDAVFPTAFHQVIEKLLCQVFLRQIGKDRLNVAMDGASRSSGSPH